MNEKNKQSFSLNRKILAKEWFDAAESDYQYAEVGLREETVFPQIAFLCQQAAEKYLKGFLVLNGIEPLRIHELPKLLDECVKINPKLEELRDACELLAGFYIEARYPPDIPKYTEDEVRQAFEQAKTIKEIVEQFNNLAIEQSRQS